MDLQPDVDFDVQEYIREGFEDDFEPLLRELDPKKIDAILEDGAIDTVLDATTASSFLRPPKPSTPYNIWHMVLPAISHAYVMNKSARINKKRLLQHIRYVIEEFLRSLPGNDIDFNLLSYAVFEESVNLEEMVVKGVDDLGEEWTGEYKVHAHVVVRYENRYMFSFGVSFVLQRFYSASSGFSVKFV